jgi:outer membrane protein TolC
MEKTPSFISSVRFLILSPLILYSLVFVLQGIARGENPKEEKVVLGLPELIQMAISKSPEIGEIQSDIAATKFDLEQVKSAYYPQLESTALVGPVQDAKLPQVVNGQITDPSPSLSLSSIGIFGRLDLTVTQPLYTFGKLSNRKEAASRGVRAKEFQVAEKKGQIVLRVKELYYALILARGGLTVANESMNFFEEAGRRIHSLLELGSPNVKESDLFRIDAYRADSIRFKAQAETGVKVSYFALKSLIQWPPGVEFEPAERTLPTKREGLTALESYLQNAADKRPEFKQLAEALAAQESQVKAATSDRYPSFFAALHGSLAGAPGREVLYSPYIRDEFNHAYAGVVAGLRWNFDFGIAKAKVDKMRAEYDKLTHTKAFAEMNIPIQVAKSYQQHMEWQAAVESYQKAAVASRRWILTGMADFDMGVGTAYDMLNAIDKYGYNQGRYLEALFRYNLSLAELEYAVGMKTW